MMQLDRHQFAQAVSRVAPFVRQAPRDDDPLSFARLVVDGDKATLSAHNKVCSARVTVDAHGEGSGEMLVPVREMQRFLDTGSGKDVKIKVSDGRFWAKVDRRKIGLPVMDHDKYWEMDNESDKHYAYDCGDTGKLARAIALGVQTSDASHKVVQRNSVLLNQQRDKLIVSAFCRHVCVCVVGEHDGDGPLGRVALPQQAARRVGGALDSSVPTVVRVGEYTVHFHQPGRTYTVRLNDSKGIMDLPTAVRKSSQVTLSEVNRKELLRICQDASVVTVDDSTYAKFCVGPESVSVSRESKHGSFDGEIDVLESDGTEYSMYANPLDMAAYLRAMPGDSVMLSIRNLNSKDAILLSPVSDPGCTVYMAGMEPPNGTE